MNIIDCTRWLPKKARELGAIAASAFGAGFGGSVWVCLGCVNCAALSAWHTKEPASGRL
jgi:hypothetical protein